MDKAYLVGPFFGELSWEYFRFAPYAIHLKNKTPDAKMIVLTRASRFDLYGQYADVLIPLQIEDEHLYTQRAFKLIGLEISTCQKISDIFRIKYKKKYSVLDHVVPDFSSLRYHLKWQFPRRHMDYNFVPRSANVKLINQLFRGKNIIVADEGYDYITSKYDVVQIEDFMRYILTEVDNHKMTYMGCLIQLIKKSKLVISNLNSDVGRLALLLKTPLIYPNRKTSNDNVHLMNPLKTKIIDCTSIIEGVGIYENNI